MIKILAKKDTALKPWDHCIDAADLDASTGNLPPFFRDLRSDQAGHRGDDDDADDSQDGDEGGRR